MTKPETLRKRHMAAAVKQLSLIRDGALTHLGILEEGKVPEGSFAVSIAKYDMALAALRALDALGQDGGDGDTAEVSLDALRTLIELLRASDVASVIEGAEDGSPLGDILAVVDEKGARE